MILRKTFRFEASHVLPHHPGKCSRLHGHSWVLHVFVEGKVNPKTGFVMDYGDISTDVKPLIDRLDHRHLGAFHFIEMDSPKDWGVPGMSSDNSIDKETYENPTSENLLVWIAYQLDDMTWSWSKIALEETCTSYAELTFEEWHQIRKDRL